MKSVVFERQVIVSPEVRINYLFPINQQKEKASPDLFRSLAVKGLDCLTDAKIEQVMCTSALSAHI